MKLKKVYKFLQKTFPNADIFVKIRETSYWLANPSTPLRKYGNLEVVSIEMDEDCETGEPSYFIRVKEK